MENNTKFTEAELYENKLRERNQTAHEIAVLTKVLDIASRNTDGVFAEIITDKLKELICRL
jgi:hypothetical protein